MDQSLTSNNNNSLQDYKNAINIINPYNDSVTIGKIQKEGFKYYSDFFNMHYNLIKQYCNETIDEYGNTLVHILAIVNGGEKFFRVTLFNSFTRHILALDDNNGTRTEADNDCVEVGIS